MVVEVPMAAIREIEGQEDQALTFVFRGEVVVVLVFIIYMNCLRHLNFDFFFFGNNFDFGLWLLLLYAMMMNL